MPFKRLIGVLAACVLVAGCGDPNIGTVSGTVTVDGEPLLAGSISFFPVDGQSPSAGASIQNGKYTARVPVGAMKVSITYPKVAGTKKLYNTPDSPVGIMYKEGLPARYNERTELTFDVKPGSNTKDWELKTTK
jgi:hypothetical protein